MLARDIGVRGTLDIDLYREVAREIAAADLREAAALDLGDWFRFEIGPPRPLVDTGGVRLPVNAFVGNTEWAAFHVDLVGEDLRMTGEPEDVPPLARVVMPDVEQHGYRAYPLVDHVADKACAIFERMGAVVVLGGIWEEESARSCSGPTGLAWSAREGQPGDAMRHGGNWRPAAPPHWDALYPRVRGRVRRRTRLSAPAARGAGRLNARKAGP